MANSGTKVNTFTYILLKCGQSSLTVVWSVSCSIALDKCPVITPGVVLKCSQSRSVLLLKCCQRRNFLQLNCTQSRIALHLTCGRASTHTLPVGLWPVISSHRFEVWTVFEQACDPEDQCYRLRVESRIFMFIIHTLSIGACHI